jgi:GDP-D-mannose dehydratase
MSTIGASGTALITGSTGQDGYYLSQLLQRNGFDEIDKAMVSFDLRQEHDACGKNLKRQTLRTSPASSRSLLI